MAGTPSARGCESCRKQKKKCDQVKPVCSRCNRLEISCVGAGRQRYKFIADKILWNTSTSTLLPASTSTTLQTSCDKMPSRQLRHNIVSQQLVRPPANDMTALTNGFIWRLRATDDLKFNLTWTYGCFMEDIPARLGTNEALDAAVAALLAVHASICSRYNHNVSYSPTVEVLSKYSRALKTLKVCLDDPMIARKAETLCSVMILLICQGLIGSDDESNWSSHGKGAAQILKIRGYYNAEDSFENKLLLTLRGPVLFEALVNPKINFSSEEWKILVENDLDGNSHEGQIMRCLTSLPDIMQRGRLELQSRADADLQVLVEETSLLNTTAKAIATNLHQKLEAAKPVDGSLPSATFLGYVHAYNLRLYGIGVTICLIYNSVLRSLGANNPDLDADSIHYCKEVLWLSLEAAVYRPLCASYVSLCLLAAWCNCQDDTLRMVLQAALADYQTDFGGRPISILGLEQVRRQISITFDGNKYDS